MAMLGQGMLILGVPIAVTTTVQAHREAKDRGFANVAMFLLGIQALLVLVALAKRFMI